MKFSQVVRGVRCDKPIDFQTDLSGILDVRPEGIEIVLTENHFIQMDATISGVK